MPVDQVLVMEFTTLPEDMLLLGKASLFLPPQVLASTYVALQLLARACYRCLYCWIKGAAVMATLGQAPPCCRPGPLVGPLKER